MAVLLNIAGATSQVNGNQWTGQSFVTTDNWIIDSVDYVGVATLAGQLVRCYFWADDGGSPSAPLNTPPLGFAGDFIASSDQQPSGTFPIPGPIPATFNFTPFQLLNGVKYWVLIDSTETTGGIAALSINIGGGLYANGNGAWGGDFNGPYTGWSDQSTVDILLTINGTVGLLSTGGKRRGWTSSLVTRRRRM